MVGEIEPNPTNIKFPRKKWIYFEMDEEQTILTNLNIVEKYDGRALKNTPEVTVGKYKPD